ncbi:MAG: glycosyltransferase family 9 protein [Chlamydiia bacterium]|nr:glycosyltransferase family 9 protein [Chlamydiia bacterium]
MRKAAVLCASGIGDGLLMMIAAHHLAKAGYTPTIYHEQPEALAPLFPSHSFSSYPPLEKLEETLAPFEKVIVENDHGERAWHLAAARDANKLSQITFLFPTESKLFRKGDLLFNPRLPIASNLSLACETLLGTPPSKENDLLTMEGKNFRAHEKRVVIHPTSNDPKRNWKKKQFLLLAERLKERGFFSTFCVASHEREEWKGVDIPSFPSLKEVAEYLYESGYLIGNDSGLGHLASNLGIPTLTISGNPKRVRLWRPDWAVGIVKTLPFPLPNFKGFQLSLRENYWQRLITVNGVIKAFEELVDESRRHLL